jgi:hypothetical protein
MPFCPPYWEAKNGKCRTGLRVRLVERTPFPRFHIGESLLPRNFELFRELGLLDALEGIPKVDKYGAEFVLGSGGEPSLPGELMSYNLERAPFDARQALGASQRPPPPQEDRLLRALRERLAQLFLNGEGPLQVHRAAMAILAGHVFPRPPFALLDLLTRINRYVPLVPRRERFSLLAEHEKGRGWHSRGLDRRCWGGPYFGVMSSLKFMYFQPTVASSGWCWLR